MPLPACGIVARQDSNTSKGRALKGDTPIKPGPCQCRSGTANPDACQAPVNERGTPRNLVVVANKIGLVVVFDYSWIRLANWKTSNAAFGIGYRHPGRFGEALSGIYDHSRWAASCALRRLSPILAARSTDRSWPGSYLSPVRLPSNFRLLCHLRCVVHFNAEVANGTLELRRRVWPVSLVARCNWPC